MAAVKECEKDAYSDSKNELEQAANEYPENDSTGDVFLVAAQRSLELGQSKALLEVLHNPKHHQLLGYVGWDLAKIVFQFLPDDCVNSVKSDTLKSLLNLICNSCNPREICLSLGELLSQELTWQRLAVLLRLLRQTCSRLEGKIGSILSSILFSIQRCLRKREDTSHEQAEILDSILEFVDVIIEKRDRSISDSSTPDDIKKLEESLVSFLIALLDHPLSLLEFKMDSEERTLPENVERNYKFAETVVKFLGMLESRSLKRLLEYGIRHENEIHKQLETPEVDDRERCSLSFVGLGCLAFLTHVEEIGTQFIPLVTTGRYSLDMNMVYINTMLCHNEAKVVSKGLKLFLAVLDMIHTSTTLGHNYIDNGEFSKLVINLRNLMIHCEDSVIRQESVKGFRKVLGSFAPRGKYRLLRSLYQGDIQSGFAELLTLILKDEIVRSLEDSSEDTWFLGSNVGSFLLHDVFKLPSKVLQTEFGVIEENNRVLSALNLLRFLVIRDNENKTRIHSIFPNLQETYLKQLTDVVELSKARINFLVQQKQDEIKGTVSARTKSAEETILSVTTADGSKLEQGSLKEHLDVLQSSCLTVDMIESVLARIGEISTDKHSAKM